MGFHETHKYLCVEEASSNAERACLPCQMVAIDGLSVPCYLSALILCKA